MNPRPRSITIISWFLIIAGVLSLISGVVNTQNTQALALMAQSKIPVNIQLLFVFLGGGATLASGVLILKGRSLGRLVYIGWTVVSLIVSLFISQHKLMILPGLAFALLIIFFLFRPKANEFLN